MTMFKRSKRKIIVTIMTQSITTLFRYRIIFGSITVTVLFFVSIYLASRIVEPLETSYKKQKQFIADAGHELKTPISVISANAELLKREISDDQWLANIQYENEKMGHLVTQLLDLVHAQRTDIPKIKLDFSHLVKGKALPFESIAYEKGSTLNYMIQDQIMIIGNEDQLKQLVSILIDNMIEHGKSNEDIDIKLKLENMSMLFLQS